MAELTFEKVIVTNPFDKSKRKSLPVTLEPGQALVTYLDGAGDEVVTVVNGKIIPPSERAIYIPRRGDQLVILPALSGGSSGKSILRSIALIGIAILATVFGGPLGAALGLSAHPALAAAVGAAIILTAGSLLISAILPLPKPEQTKDTQNYGWNGPVLASRQGLPIPKMWGRFRQAGNVISSYVKTMGDKQYLNVLICYGFGPAISISDILINDNLVSNYVGVQYEVRLGSNNQSPVSFFSDSVNDRAQQKRLRTGDAYFEVDGDRSDTQGLEVEFFFPKGVWAGPDADGKFGSWSVFGSVQYKLHTDSTWTDHLVPGITADVGATPYWLAVSQEIFATTPITIVYATSNNPADHFDGELYDMTESVNIYDSDGNFVATETRRHVGTWTRNPANPATGAPAMGSVPQTVTQWTNANFTVTGNSQATRRYVFRVDNLPSGKYDVRVKKLGAGSHHVESPSTEDFSRRGEEMWLGAVREIVYDDFTYPNMVLLGVRALATDQLSGSGINITAIVDVGVSNPSKIAQAMMTNTLWGGSIPSSLLDQPKFDDWEDFCNVLVPGDDVTPQIIRADWNGVFDTSGSLWEQLAVICAVSRGTIVRTGLNYSVVIDQPDVPVQLFSVGSIVADSFKESWLALADRANSVDVRYSDAAQNYKVTPLTVDAQSGIGVGVEVRKAPLLDLRGVTNAARAFHEGELRLRQTALLKRSATFDAPVEAIACQVGDVIKIQHDIPQWGEGGKIVSAADTTHIHLDRDVDMSAGNDYVLTIIFPALGIQSGTTNDIQGSIISLDVAPSTTYKNLRLKLPGEEFAIIDISGAVATINGVSVNTGAQIYQIVAIDAIDTRVVTNVPVSGDISTADIVVSPGFSGLPFPNSTYAFGLLLHEGRDFRVTDIRGSNELAYTITGLEYLDAFYGEIDPLLPPAPSGDIQDILVSDLDAHEAYAANAELPRIAISWRPGKYTRGADLYLSRTKDFVPLPPLAILTAAGSIGFVDIWIRLTYTLSDGSETAASSAIKVAGINTTTNSVKVIDRGTALTTAASFNLYVATVSPDADEPDVSAYRFALGTTNELSLVLADTGANSGSGAAWSNPANVGDTTNFASVTLDTSHTISQLLDAAFTLSVPSEAIAGVIVTLEAEATLNSISDLTDNIEVHLTLSGMQIGAAKTLRVSSASPSTFVLGSAGDTWGTAITDTNLNDSSFRVSIRGTFKGQSAGSDMPVSILLNGWGPNAHVGDYEGGVSQGHSFGLNSGTTVAYTNANAAFNGNESDAAYSILQHTHQYAGCVWKFTNPGAPTIPNGLVLRVLSEVPYNGKNGVVTNFRSASLWYTKNNGASWTRIYDSTTRSKQWDSVVLPDGTDPTQVQVMAFNDSHDDMAHYVYEITLGVPPTDILSVRNVNIQVFGVAGTTSFAVGGSADLTDVPASTAAPLGIQPVADPPKLVASVDRQHEYIATIESSGFYTVRAVGYDAIGKRADYNLSPVVSTPILGDGSLPQNVTSFRVTAFSDPDATLAWDAINDVDIDHFEIRFNYAFDGVTWDRAATVATPASTDTTTTVSSGAGTYLIKAINTLDKESGIASAAVAGASGTRGSGDSNPDPLSRGGVIRPVRPNLGGDR